MDLVLLPTQTQKELQMATIDFNSLSTEDQKVLQGYLKELCDLSKDLNEI